MIVATYNVNSIRRRLEVLAPWLKRHQPDVLCLQETKVQDKEFPLEVLEQTGYYINFRGMKAYNGVAILSRTCPEHVSFGLGKGLEADEPRFMHAVIFTKVLTGSFANTKYESWTARETKFNKLASPLVNTQRGSAERFSGRVEGATPELPFW